MNIPKLPLISTLHRLFSTTSTVKKLMGWRANDEETAWAEKAIDTLVKKLKKKKGAIEELHRAVSNPGAPSRCVTIPRSIDGRLQVCHRKGMPHVIYCKLWRWSDLSSHHELRALDICKYPYHAKHDEVCINPYHYRRIGSPKLPEIHVTKNQSLEQEQDELLHLQMLEESMKCTMPQNVTMPYPQETPTPSTYDEILRYLEESSPQSCQPVQPVQATTVDNCYQVQQNENMYNVPANSEAIPYKEQCCWATIAYFELNCRVGEAFQCTQSMVMVDGYTSPIQDGDRFCLGKLSNVHRNPIIENVRQHIGHGVTLHYAGGELFMECTSTKSIFVQSRICNNMNGYNPTDVIKVQPGMSLKVFDTKLFSDILSMVVQKGFIATYDLIKMCTIRMSFVKGWGAAYHREDVTATPCWIEITLNGPLKWLDNVLVTMGSPPDYISSVS